LVVAVSDVRVDGVRLEGVGVEPDVHAENPALELRGNDDPQLERSLDVLATEASGSPVMPR
ncbi:MAG TPA: hypothetical protein VMS30_11185, partial [Phycisphaerales bacterium]|nr:hypothetical protein [Phycisphaerales bacterium]